MTGPLRESSYLRLSRFVRPLVSIGDQLLCPQNMTDGSDRLRYLRAVAEHLNKLRALGYSYDEVLEFHSEVPLARKLVTLDKDRDRWAQVAPQAKDFVHFSADKLTTVFADGRKRERSDMLALSAGLDTPALANLISAWVSGASAADLGAVAAQSPFECDLAFLEQLCALGILEQQPSDAQTRNDPPSADPWVMWLGHAAAAMGTAEATIWVDPWLPSVIDWQPSEVPGVFSAEFADQHLLHPYDSKHPAKTVQDLPTPSAVLITHPDIDHFDIGTLMMLPRDTAIVVPRPHPGPFDVDLAAVVGHVLGDRPVISLGHGESTSVGDMMVTAIPFDGEVPADIKHSWNSYIVDTEAGSVAFCADSVVEDAQLEPMAERLQSGKPVLFFGRLRRTPLDTTGYRDSDNEVFNEARRWPWYSTILSMFEPTPAVGVDPSALAELQKTGQLSFFPYASGSTPWHRFNRSRLECVHSEFSELGAIWKNPNCAAESEYPLGSTSLR